MESELTTPETPEQQQDTPSQTSPLQQWWQSANFTGKEYTSLADDGTLSLKENKYAKGRTVSTLNADNASAATKALSDKFPEVEAKVTELRDEWEKTEDKTRLLGRTSRLYDYLQTAVAIGNFEPLYEQVNEWRAELERLDDQAYSAKKTLVEKAEAIATGDNWKEGGNQLREIVDQWKALGFVDKARNDELWERLEAARASFTARKREHTDAIEKEMMQNLDLKMELVDKSEKLAASEEWKKTTEAFKALMEEWKGIGRTVNDKNEALWQRFIAAKNAFYDRKRMHFETIQTEQEANYATKLSIVEKAEALADSTEWNATSNAFATLMDEWKTSGRVPLEKADELWERMSKAKDNFFNAKRQHFETVRVNLEDNLARKTALLKRAEVLKNSTQWREATEEFAELMEEWKRSGPVAREHSEKIWQQFSAARRTFFDRKDADRDRRKGMIVKQQAARLQQTRDFLNTLREELKEEEERIDDFRQGLGNVGTGKKEDELRRHLEKLIAQGEPAIEKKRKKIEEVEKQMGELEREDRREAKVKHNQKPAEEKDSTVPAAVHHNIHEEPSQAIELTDDGAKVKVEGQNDSVSEDMSDTGEGAIAEEGHS